MSAHPLTHRYLEIVAEKANLPIASLNPEDTWAALGISDEYTMRRLAGALQNAAADHNPDASITLGEVTGAKDVAGGLIVTWSAAALGTLTREQAAEEIRTAQSELEQPVQEVVVTAKRKSSKKKRSKKKSVKKKSAKKKGGQKRAAKAKAKKTPRTAKRSAKRK